MSRKEVEASGGYESWIKTAQGNQADAERIRNQNTSLGRARWGTGQKEFLLNLTENYQPKGEKFKPKTWFELGVGGGAELVINALEAFGEGMENKGMVMVEKDPVRLSAAKNTLQEHFKDRPDILAKIDFSVSAGDGAEVLRKYQQQADVIHAQLFFQHLLPNERQNILQACGEKLQENGLLLVADLAFNDWTVRPSRRGIGELFQKSAVSKGRRFINEFRENVYRKNRKKDFSDVAAIENMIQEESQPTNNPHKIFEVLPELENITKVTDIRPGEDEVVFMERIVRLATPDNGEFSRHADWYIRRMKNSRRAEVFDYPTLARVVARRLS